jgi:hypothetical protein
MEAIDSASSAIVKAAESENLEVLGNQIDALMKKVTDSGSASRGPVPAQESKAATTPAPEASPNVDTRHRRGVVPVASVRPPNCSRSNS